MYVKSKIKSLQDTTRPKWFDWTFWGLVALMCAWFFCHGDLNITVWHGYDLISAIKNGRFFSFYQDVLNKALSGGYFSTPNISFAANYNILIYLVLAIWMLPVKIICYLFHQVPSTLFLTMYCKQLILLAILASGYLLSKIGTVIGLAKERCQWLAFLFMSGPILLFGSVLFGQIDIFSVFFTLLAFLFYLQKRYYWFSAIMSVAICFKAFPVFIFIPLILLIEKRILHILKFGIIGSSLLLFTQLLARFDPGYRATKSALSDIYNFTDRIYKVKLPTAFEGTSALIFAFLLICLFCYVVQPDDMRLSSWAISISFLSYAVLFTFLSPWHPQWLILLCPFAALSLSLVNNHKAAILMDCAMNLGYIVFVPIYFSNNVDFNMLNSGILPQLFHEKFLNHPISVWFGNNANLIRSASNALFIAGLVSLVIYTAYDLIHGKKIEERQTPPVMERGLIWIRMGILLGFITVGLLWYSKQILSN